MLTQSTEIPHVAIMSETDILRQLVVEKTIIFKFSVSMRCLQGFEGSFECVCVCF